MLGHGCREIFSRVCNRLLHEFGERRERIAVGLFFRCTARDCRFGCASHSVTAERVILDAMSNDRSKLVDHFPKDVQLVGQSADAVGNVIVIRAIGR